MIIHGGGPKREHNLDGRRQQDDAKPIQLQESGIRGRNPSQSFQVNYSEHSTRKTVPTGNLRSKSKPNNPFSDKSRIPPKLSRPTDLNFPLE